MTAETTHIYPRLSVLTAEQVDQVHGYALDVLAHTGVRIDSPRIRDVLGRVAGSGSVSGERVRLPAELVEWAIESAPASIDIYNRTGDLRFRLGEGRARFGIGVTTLFYQDPQTDALTSFARQHMRQMTRLGGALPLYDVVSTLGVVQDVPPEVCDLYGTLEMTANTTKPLVVLVSAEESFAPVLDMLTHLHGELAEKPFIIPYFNPVTPLVLNLGTLEKMEIAIQRGLPFIFSNYSMAGMSTPITPGGTLVVLLAELLAGLTVSQVLKEGTPVILGILPAYFEMKTMVNFYDPASILLNLACAEMMAHYRLPHCGTSGSGSGWGPDLIAADTYWMNHLTAVMGQVGLAPFVGDNLTSKAFSPVNVVYAHEIIAQALRFAGGFAFDAATACLEDIHSTGPGGNFLSSPSTLKHYRNAYYPSPIFPRYSLEKWQAQGSPPAIQVLRAQTLEAIHASQPPADHAELLQRGEDFIAQLTRR